MAWNSRGTLRSIDTEPKLHGEMRPLRSRKSKYQLSHVKNHSLKCEDSHTQSKKYTPVMRRSYRTLSISHKIDLTIQCHNPLPGRYPNPANGNYRFKGQSHQRKRPLYSTAMGKYYDPASLVPRVQR